MIGTRSLHVVQCLCMRVMGGGICSTLKSNTTARALFFKTLLIETTGYERKYEQPNIGQPAPREEDVHQGAGKMPPTIHWWGVRKPGA